MKKTLLKNYAKLVVTMGLNVQKGQDVLIRAELDQPEFVKYAVDECYKAGARKVMVEWSYQPLTKLHVKHQSLKTLSEVTSWEEEKLKYQSETLPCELYIMSEDPDGLSE